MKIGKDKYCEYNKFFKNIVDNQRFLIAAHRGQWKGNIIQNSVNASILTRKFGAEIMELDIAMTKDQKFVVFHTGKEKYVLEKDIPIHTFSFEEIQELKTKNSLGDSVNEHIQSLEHLLQEAPNDLIFQLDRCEGYFDTLLDYLASFDTHIKERILIKCSFKSKSLSSLNDFNNYKFMVMPILSNVDDLSKLENYIDLNLVGIEVLAKSEESRSFGKSFSQMINEKFNALVQLNAIKLNDEEDLYAGYNDDSSLLNSPEEGWGKLLECGANIIQTDWALPLAIYRKSIKK